MAYFRRLMVHSLLLHFVALINLGHWWGEIVRDFCLQLERQVTDTGAVGHNQVPTSLPFALLTDCALLLRLTDGQAACTAHGIDRSERLLS